MEDREDSGLTPEVCEQLLVVSTSDPEAIKPSPCDALDMGGLLFVTGYPDSPLYERLADCMAYWLITG